jgi:hypothetical protein
LNIFGRHLELTKVPQSWLMKIYQSCLGFWYCLFQIKWDYVKSVNIKK